MKRLVRLLLSLPLILLAMPACGAKFPGAIERSITITGPAAEAAAHLLGFSGPRAAPTILRLGRGESWAVYLLKQDTAVPLSNDDGMPDRFNAVGFSLTPAPTLTLGPYWLDLGTALPNTQVGYYAFGSPFEPEALEGSDAWVQLLRQLRADRAWSETAQPRIRKCFASDDRGELCIEAFGLKDYTDNIERGGYVARLVVHPPR